MKQTQAVERFLSDNPTACTDAKTWLLTCGSAKEAWEKCERPDWMLWAIRQSPAIIKRIGKHAFVAFAVACAERTVKEYARRYPDDSRPQDAIKAAKRWLRNPNKTNANAANAANAAHAAAYAAYAVAYAAYAAAYAAANTANAAYVAHAADAAERKWQANELRKLIRKLIRNPFLAYDRAKP